MGSAQAKLTTASSILPTTPTGVESKNRVADSVDAITADLARANNANATISQSRAETAIKNAKARAERLDKFSHDQFKEMCEENSALQKQAWALEGKLNESRELCDLRQAALDNLLRALEVQLPNWKKTLAGELIWPCDICVALHAKESGSKSTKCTVCKHKKCVEMFDADFLDEAVDADYCGDCCNEFEDVCGECITRRAKHSKGGVRRCACGQVCCVHKLRGMLHIRCVSTPTVE